MDRAVPLSTRITRRRMLQSGGVAVAAVAMGSLPAVAPAREVALRRSMFTPLVGDTFTLDGIPARLATVDDYGAGRLRAEVGSQAAFVLIFHASPRARRLDQDIVTVRHPSLGRIRMLVTPAGTGRSGQDYNAVVDTRRAARP